MASQGVSGKTLKETLKRRAEYDGNKPFDKRYCLAKIPKQPDDYDGPPRYCFSMETRQLGDEWICKYHGGAGEMHTENLDDPHTAAMKHGMKATVKNLMKDFDDKDEALYEWVVETYPESYDLDLESDPQARYNLHELVVEMVRAERGEGYLIQEGEQQESEVRNEEGQIVLDEEGNVVTEKSEHYLANMMVRQRGLIKDLEKKLGITRRERMKRDQTDNAVEAIKSFSELGNTFLDRSNQDFDGPGSWDNNEQDTDG